MNYFLSFKFGKYGKANNSRCFIYFIILMLNMYYAQEKNEIKK